MDACPKCNSLLRIGNSFYTFENDDTPDAPTKVFTNLPLICLNKECDNYGGGDLSNPRFVVDTVVNQLNKESE